MRVPKLRPSSSHVLSYSRGYNTPGIEIVVPTAGQTSDEDVTNPTGWFAGPE